MQLFDMSIQALNLFSRSHISQPWNGLQHTTTCHHLAVPSPTENNSAFSKPYWLYNNNLLEYPLILLALKIIHTLSGIKKVTWLCGNDKQHCHHWTQGLLFFAKWCNGIECSLHFFLKKIDGCGCWPTYKMGARLPVIPTCVTLGWRAQLMSIFWNNRNEVH